MKKSIILFLVALVAMCFLFGCQNPVSSDPGGSSGRGGNTTAQKIALYQRILGTYQENLDNTSDVHVFVFTMDSITLDGIRYAFNPQTDLYFEDEVPEGERYWQKTFYMHFNNDYYPVEFNANIQPEEEIYITIGDKFRSYIRIAGPAGGSGGGAGSIDFSIVGSWKYTIAGTNSTTLAINDGGTFSFTKNVGGNYSGTYQLSGNQVTFSYQTITGATTVKVDDTFAISGNANQMTLTLVSSNTETNGSPQVTTETSAMLLAFYNSPSTSITLSK